MECDRGWSYLCGYEGKGGGVVPYMVKSLGRRNSTGATVEHSLKATAEIEKGATA